MEIEKMSKEEIERKIGQINRDIIHLECVKEALRRRLEDIVCSNCRGKGWLIQSDEPWEIKQTGFIDRPITCPDCKGKGILSHNKH